MRAAPQNGVRVSPTHPLLSRAWPRNVWHPSAHWETSRIAAKFIGPRAARYGRSRPLLTLAPFTALRTRARVEKEYLPTHPWAIEMTPARALRKWRATGVNQFGHTANAVWRPSRKGLASRLAALARGARINFFNSRSGGGRGHRAAAPVKSCQSLPNRSPWGRLGSVLYTCKRLHRRRRRFNHFWSISLSRPLGLAIFWPWFASRAPREH